MDLGPKSPNNEFVESRLINWALGNQTNFRMELDVERVKKKRICDGINRPQQDPRRSVLIYFFQFSYKFPSLCSSVSSSFLYPLPLSFLLQTCILEG